MAWEAQKRKRSHNAIKMGPVAFVDGIVEVMPHLTREQAMEFYRFAQREGKRLGNEIADMLGLPDRGEHE